MKVIDNFLPEEEFKLVQALMMDYGFPWFYNDSVTKDPYPQNCKEFQFVHLFYNPLCGMVSEYPRWKDIVKPYADRLVSTAILRIKANLNIATKEFITREFHTDFNIKCKTAVIYINTNNGYTLFEDGNKVESVENRVVIFDSHMRHAGIPCTDEKRRVVINFNFI